MTDSKIEQFAYVAPGYDCREVCTHERPAAGPRGHGIHCEEWIYVVKNAEVAIALHVMTPFFPPTVDTSTLPAFMLGRFNGSFIGLCTVFPMTREQIRKGAEPEPCKYLGKCYRGSTWGLLAEDIVTKRFDSTAKTIDAPQPALWRALHYFFRSKLDQLAGERHKDGDLGWMRCPHCNGNGVVAKS